MPNPFEFDRDLLYNKVLTAANNYNPAQGGQNSRQVFATTIADAVSESLEPLIQALNNHTHSFTYIDTPPSGMPITQTGETTSPNV